MNTVMAYQYIMLALFYTMYERNRKCMHVYLSKLRELEGKVKVEKRALPPLFTLVLYAPASFSRESTAS